MLFQSCLIRLLSVCCLIISQNRFDHVCRGVANFRHWVANFRHWVTNFRHWVTNFHHWVANFCQWKWISTKASFLSKCSKWFLWYFWSEWLFQMNLIWLFERMVIIKIVRIVLSFCQNQFSRMWQIFAGGCQIYHYSFRNYNWSKNASNLLIPPFEMIFAAIFEANLYHRIAMKWTIQMNVWENIYDPPFYEMRS